MAKRPLSGLSPTRERAYQERARASLERNIRAKLDREIKRATRKIADVYNSPGAVAGVIEEHKKRLAGILGKHYDRVFLLFGQRLINGAKRIKQADQFTLPPAERFARAQQAWIAQFGGIKIQRIGATTYEQTIDIINEIIKQSVAEGLTEAETGRRIVEAINSDSVAMSRLRSRIIARTETHNASQAASHLAAKATGLPTSKEWVTAGQRARDDHAEANGQIRPLDEPFDVGGEKLMYPGDPSGSPENVINCRCISVHMIE